MARENESSPKPLSAPGGSQSVSSGTLLGQIGHKLVICFTVSGNLTIQTLDGVGATLTSIPIGCFTFDVQHDKVTWTGTATAVSFYRIDG